MGNSGGQRLGGFIQEPPRVIMVVNFDLEGTGQIDNDFRRPRNAILDES